MKELAIGIFIMLMLAAFMGSNDPLGWESQARIEQQTQLAIGLPQIGQDLLFEDG